jgi:hypothetical protein
MIILLEKAANSIPNPDAGKATLFVDTSGNLQVKLDDGSLGNIQAKAGSFTGAVNLGSVANLTITGGTSGQVLKTYGNGTVYFGVDSAAAGGSNTQIQYNDQGVANGSAAFVFNNTTNAITASGNLQAGNLSATLVTGTLTTNAQPNVTSVGSLTGLTVSNATGVVDFTTTANVTLGNVSNLHISGGSSGYVLQTNGSGDLSWAAQSGSASISNGNSSINIPLSMAVTAIIY